MGKQRVAIYVRVSTQDQSTAMQKSDLEQYVQARGWEIGQIYEDKASGTDANRPSLKQLLSDAKQIKFNTILCWKLDRLFRSLREMVNTLHELNELGVQFISLKDNIDLTTSSGRLLTHLLAAFAEFEASLIRERVTAGVRAKIKKTGHWGRRSNRPDALIQQLKAKELSNRAIGRKLGISEASVRRSLKSATNTLKKGGT